MKYNGITYLIGEGFSNIFKNKKSTITSIITMICMMFLFGLFFAIGVNVNYMLEQVQMKPAFVYRQVQVFYDPIIRRDQDVYVNEALIDTIKKEIDRRLSYPILLKRDTLTGKYSMSLIPEIIEERFSKDEPHTFIERPDGTTGRLIYDSSIYDTNEHIDYDTGWALDLWMEPVYVNWCIDGVWIE